MNAQDYEQKYVKISKVKHTVLYFNLTQDYFTERFLIL